MRLLILGILFLIGVSAWVIIPLENNSKINGVSLVSPPRVIEAEKVGEVKNINASWAAIIPYGFSRSGQPSVTFDHERQWWGEKTEGTIELIKYAKQHGLKVMVKPHVWVLGEGWTGDYKLDTESDWSTWEKDYKAYILNYAKTAESMGVELFCIGTEYRDPAKKRPEFWRLLASEVREVFSGKITYAANWDNYQYISWWDAVDYIGIDSYFPLADGDSPTVDEIKTGWEPLEKELERFAQKWGKQILFTEYGFQSAKGGAGKHWEVNKSVEFVDFEVQSNAYEATFQSIWSKEWFAGGFLWKWHLTTRGSEHNKTRFTPQGKPAEEVIKNWYRKSS